MSVNNTLLRRMLNCVCRHTHCSSNAIYSTSDMCNIWLDCAFYDNSMTFGRQLQYAPRRIFLYRDIADLSQVRNGGYFTKWLPSGTRFQCQTDWTNCVWYQKGIDEELSCPPDAKRGITEVCCKTLADFLLGFCKIESFRSTAVYVARMGDGMKATFHRNRVKWHDSCRLEFNSTQILRADEMRTPCEHIADVPKKYTRQSVDQAPQSKDKCLFCGQQDSNYERTLHGRHEDQMTVSLQHSVLWVQPQTPPPYRWMYWSFRAFRFTSVWSHQWPGACKFFFFVSIIFSFISDFYEMPPFNSVLRFLPWQFSLRQVVPGVIQPLPLRYSSPSFPW